MTKTRTPDEYLGYDPDLVGAIERAPDGSPLRRRPSEEPPDPEYEKEKERLRKWQVITVPPGFLEEALAARKAQREANAAGPVADSDEPAPSSATQARAPRAAAELGGIRSLERPDGEPLTRRAGERSASVVAPREAHDSAAARGARREWTLSPDLAAAPGSIPTRPGVPIALAAARDAAGTEDALVVPMRPVNRAYRVVLALILLASVGGLVALSAGLKTRGASPTEQAGAGREPPSSAPAPTASDGKVVGAQAQPSSVRGQEGSEQAPAGPVPAPADPNDASDRAAASTQVPSEAAPATRESPRVPSSAAAAEPNSTRSRGAQAPSPRTTGAATTPRPLKPSPASSSSGAAHPRPARQKELW